MKIFHRIGINPDEVQRRAFQAAGVELETGFGVFRIAEADPRWPQVEALVERYSLPDFAETRFTEAEKRRADYLSMGPTWHHGYPEPSEDFGYLSRTYDLLDYCAGCGIGKRQAAPFRFKTAPKWGRQVILQLNWIFDEYFVEPSFWRRVLEPLGIGVRPVVLDRSGEALDSVLQLVIPAGPGLDLDGRPVETCPLCRREKYLPITRGFFPAPEDTDALLFKSAQLFGSGASAEHGVLVSNALYRAFAAEKAKGVAFAPCEA
ncbi:MAG: hypothetical protein QNJ30_21020 [Kiloniellales bacterium]|nr:hypothetical protein [Kiloniellales bacterium]